MVGRMVMIRRNTSGPPEAATFVWNMDQQSICMYAAYMHEPMSRLVVIVFV